MHKAILVAVAGEAGVPITLMQHTSCATLQLHGVLQLLHTHQQAMQVAALPQAP
jgi:hypothetical protein